MSDDPGLSGGPYVVAVASEKGGVGKTTIATNLAVYLKALREDLPVTVASFDNHFSVDNMFAIRGHRGQSVGGLFAGQSPETLATLGEYGVSFLASERQLQPPDNDGRHLRRHLSRSHLPGILVLDTRPILDYFTRNALLAADLVLTPVKDRASLVNAASLAGVLEEGGAGTGHFWLVPSLIDARLRLRENLGMLQFLVASAEERGYQVFETGIFKSPKVESLATNLTSRVYPVLTHARGTQVHGQLRALAEFVLAQRAQTPQPLSRQVLPQGEVGPASRLLAERCPVCRAPGPTLGRFFQGLRSHRRGFLHEECLAARLQTAELQGLLDAAALLAVQCDEAGEVSLQLLDGNGEELVRERPLAGAGEGWRELAAAVAGCQPEELYRECLLIGLAPAGPADWGQLVWRREFAGLRRRALAQLATLEP